MSDEPRKPSSRQSDSSASGPPAEEGEASDGAPTGAESAETAPDGGVGDEPSPERRRFLAGLALGIGAAAGGALIVPWTGLFVTPAATRDPAAWREVGRLEDFRIGETRKVTYLDPDPLPWAGYVGRSAAWVRRESADELAAFTSYCTHVGCPVRWEEGARLFMCPCHGGAFYPDGSVAAGPPPRPLDRYPIRIHDGMVEVQAVGVPRPG